MSKKKKPFYVSLNRTELDLLADASYEEVTLYVTVLKRLANFNTGAVGTFNKAPLTYEDLAKQLSRASSQGKPGIAITRDRVRDLVHKLQSRQLLSDVQVLGKHLIMLLPLSPIDYDNAEVPTVKPTQEAPSQKKKVQTKGKQEAQNPDEMGLEEVVADSASVLINTHQSHSTLNTPPIDSSAEQAGLLVSIEGGQQAEDSDQWSEPLADDIGDIFADDNTEGENSPSIAFGDIHPSSLEMEAHFNAPLLSADSIAKLMRERGILHAGTDTSKGLYMRWLRAGITGEQLEEALETVNGDMTMQQTPHSVDAVLSGRSANRQSKRGGLVL